MTTPTQRSLAVLRKCEDWDLVEVVERWNQWAGIRNDLFGFIDILVCSKDVTLGIQATSSSNHNARVTKILTHPYAAKWLACPWREIEVWSWGKRKVKRGGKAFRYVLRRSKIVLNSTGSHPIEVKVQKGDDA